MASLVSARAALVTFLLSRLRLLRWRFGHFSIHPSRLDRVTLRSPKNKPEGDLEPCRLDRLEDLQCLFFLVRS